MKTQEVIRLLLSESMYAFTSESVRKRLNLSSTGVYKVLKSLEKNGLIERVGRGIYILGRDIVKRVPPELLIDSLLRDKSYYFGLFTSLSFWRMSDSIFEKKVILTTEKTYSGREIDLVGVSFRFIYINKKRFFGFQRVPFNVGYVNISDREKTLLDVAYFIGRYTNLADLCKAIQFSIIKLDGNKIVDYLYKFNSHAVAQRLGYLLDEHGLDIYNEIKELISKNIIPLDPKSDNKGVLNEKWRINVNNRC